MIRHLLANAVILLITGCAATGSGPDAAPIADAVAPSDGALIYAYRPAALSGSANVYTLSIDGIDVAAFGTGTRKPLPVEPGPHVLSSATVLNPLNFGLAFLLMEKPQLRVDAGPGETVFIEISTGFAGGPALRRVADEEGRKEARGLARADQP